MSRHVDWLAAHAQAAARASPRDAVLDRARLGMRAGGALAGVCVRVKKEACAVCRAVGATVFDPDFVPPLPVPECTTSTGCECVYAHVMAYEVERLAVDHRPKPDDYADTILVRLRLGTRAGGAIHGVRIVAATDACTACRQLHASTWEPSTAPRIPYSTCTSVHGCRCAYLPDADPSV